MTYIYLAVPWAPMGGGMFRVADYLIQSQAPNPPAHSAQLRPLDTRGGGSAFHSGWVLLIAMAKLVRGRLEGNLAGVHVNMAERLSVVRKGAVIALCRALGVPVVLHLHAAQLHQFYESLPSLFRWLTRWIFSLPASVVVLGTASRRFVIDALKVPADRVHILNNGVPEPTRPRDKGPAGSARRILFVGNLSERKGVSDLLHALTRPVLREGPPLEVTLAGGGDVATYQAKAQELGVADLVRFEGWVDQDRVAQLMARAHVLVLPSYDEGLPLVILEALANGVAVVCTPVGEIPSVLSDGVNACFVTPGDVDGIASALHRVMGEPALMDTLGRNGRGLYEQEFSLSRFFANVARIHQRYFGVAALPGDLTDDDPTWPSAATIRASGSPRSGATERSSRYIYLASPWSPVCGGIYKVVDYLFRSHTPRAGLYGAQLRPLDTRGGGHAFFSFWFLLAALARILFGQLRGGLAGVHVNVAERLSLVRKGSIVLVCRAIGVPVVLHLHAQMRSFYLGLPVPLQAVIRWVFSLASGVVVIGPAARRFVTEDLGVRPDRVELVFNGVPEPTEPRRKPEPGRVQQLLFLGRLGDAKGVSDLLQALTLSGFDRKRVRLTIAGGGDVAGYQAKAQVLGVADMVHFAGLCNQEEVAQLLAQADVLVLPSYDEVLPLAILEALANGVAVVCTPVGELPSVLCGGVNALFVTPGDVRSLAEGLQQVLRDPELQDRLARNGRALYEQQFSMTRFFWGIARVHRRHFGLAAQPLHTAPRPAGAAPVRAADEVRPT